MIDPTNHARLRKLCQSFGIHEKPDVPERGMVTILVAEGPRVRCDVVKASAATTRLLSEMCSKMVPWVAFRLGQSCAELILTMPEQKIQRIAQLYRLASGIESRRGRGRPPKHAHTALFAAPEPGSASIEMNKAT